ncbi:nuclear speckle splicing regulatory protein 1 [Brassica rapa]|uniref:Nuclear speckle splicing regulatory protein 1 N-terminal domain-containing protein n=1 Tax=Brassica campestris TaxID=3711 RepID=M4EZV0_BRACM|nr:nuclear speckle splicing regulatory protein 1 [Brassica rapa]
MKKYGLQIRAPSQKKQPTVRPPRPSIFDEDEDVDVEKEISRQASKTKSHKETEEQLKKALEEDPSAFAYDEVIDDIKQKAIVPKLQDRQDRKPRYVQHLMKKAEQRQKEHEIVYERKLAKEREKDDDLFSGKEKFITGAYKRKLEEQKKWLAEERLRELREERDDVTKKKDLSDFYFNMVNNVALGARGIEEKEEQRKAEKMEEEMRKEEKKAESPEKEVLLLPESQDVGSSRKRSMEPQEEEEEKDASEKKIGSDVVTEEEKDSSSKEEAKEAPKATTTTQHKKSEDAIAAARERFLARKKAKVEE